jgi:hypothetical protein
LILFNEIIFRLFYFIKFYNLYFGVSQCPNVTSISEVDRKRFIDPNNLSNYPAYILVSEPLFKRCLPLILSSFKTELINEVIK